MMNACRVNMRVYSDTGLLRYLGNPQDGQEMLMARAISSLSWQYSFPELMECDQNAPNLRVSEGSCPCTNTRAPG